MGIKMVFGIGSLIVAGIAAFFRNRQKEDERNEKIQIMIHDVDMKKKEEEQPKTVEELANDIDRALSGMDVDGDDAEPKARTFEEIEKTYQDMRSVKQAILDRQKPHVIDNASVLEAAQEQKDFEDKMNELHEKQNDPEWQAEQERLRKEAEAKKEAAWKRKVKKAIEQKNYRTLEDLFDAKYAGGPWHPSPASVFGDACRDGVITDDFYHMAAEYFGKLWNYSGD